MSRDFHPINSAVWSSPGFLDLDDSDSRLLHFYFMTGPHQNSSGCCRVREGYALADLRWASAQYRSALANIVAACLVLHDPATEETYVQKWFQHKGNIPTNQAHARGVMKIISLIDSDEIRGIAEADFMGTEWGRKVFPSPDNEATGNPLDGPVVHPISSSLANSRLLRRGT